VELFSAREEAMELIAGLSPLPITEDIREIVREYIERLLMPADPSGDALHLALASYYGCDFLATWNCKHLANANKFDNIARVNGILKLSVPKLVTPLELIGNGNNDD
jgi:predicted nucleic acid-binding protein